MSLEIVIPCSSIRDALIKAEEFDAIFAKDCFLQEGTSNLRFDADFIDDRMIEAMEVERILEETKPQPRQFSKPVRVDTALELDSEGNIELLQIEASFLEAWQDANGDQDVLRQAQANRQRLRRKLRLDFLDSIIRRSVVGGDTLIYGLEVNGAVCLEEADGNTHEVEVLIHATHPASPEDLYLRERQVQCDRILRWRIPGLDDGDWMRQNEPRETLDAKAWRRLLSDRAKRAI